MYERIRFCEYQVGIAAFRSEDYNAALEQFTKLGNYDDVKQWIGKTHYMLGVQAYEAEDYKTSVSNFKVASGFSDISNWLQKSYYQLGINLLQAGEYDSALESFEQVNDYLDTDEWVIRTKHEKAITCYEAQDYEQALSLFLDIAPNEDIDEWLGKTYYNAGMKAFDEGDYEKAFDYLNKCEDGKNLKEWKEKAIFMLGESAFSESEYEDALSYYQQLPKSFEYNGKTVQDRINSIELYHYFQKYAGEYTCTYAYAEVRQINKSYGSWNNWYRDDKNGSLVIDVAIDEDGAVVLTGEASGWIYTQYSIISSGVQGRTCTVSFSKTLTSKNLPTKLFSDEKKTITFNGGTSFTFTYYLFNTNEDIYFNYKYDSEYRFVKK